jgi:hypothetical protein
MRNANKILVGKPEGNGPTCGELSVHGTILLK